MKRKRKEFKSVQEELIYIKEQNGGLCPPAKVVEYAEDPGTLLHSRFTWDDTKAAHEYRLYQARYLIRLELTIIENETMNEPISLRLFYSLPNDRNKDGGYRLVTDILSDPVHRKALLDNALKELLHFKQKYEMLSELAKVFEAIDDILPEESTKIEFQQIRQNQKKKESNSIGIIHNE
ncbi:MAG: hypothetical protein PHT07_23945 [Paludibacter sp.]|nr:hypothetical protein [Paludibacter sp.]